MKQVWVNRSTCSCTAAATCGAALPTVVTAIPEPKSISELPSASTTTPPPAATANTDTADDTAACRRAVHSRDTGPGISVTSRRSCGSAGPPCTSTTVIALPRFARSALPRRAVSSVRSQARSRFPHRAHHVLDPGVVLQGVRREVLAVTRLLEPAVRHLRDQRDVRVDPYAAELERPRHADRPRVVGGEHARREPVGGVVGELQRLRLVRERLHGDDRPEDLVAGDLVV